MPYETKRIKDNYLYAPLPLWFLYLYFIKRSWLHCNPSNELINNQEVLKHYFFLDEKIIFKNKLDNQKYDITKFDNIKDIFLDNNFKLVFLYGNKGYGKTTIQNYLLMKYTKELNENKLSWLRIDVSKIYREWQGFREIDLTTYLYLQIVYVYIRYYKNNDDVFKNKFENIKIDLEEKGILEIFNEFEEKLTSSQNCVQHSKMQKKAYLLQNINNTKRIAEILLEHLSGSIILFIDGIDNLDYQNNYRETFAEQIKDILKLSNNTFSLQKFKSIVIALRYENEKFFHDILKASEQNHYTRGHLKIEQYEIENISFSKIISSIKDNFEIISTNTMSINSLLLKSLKELADINTIESDDKFTEDTSVKNYILQMISKLEKYDEKNIKEESAKFQLSLNYAAVVFDIERKIGLTVNDIADISHYLLNVDNKIFDFLERYEEYIKKCLEVKGLAEEIENADVIAELFQNNYREALSHAINSFLYIKKFIQRKEHKKSDDIDTYLSKNSKILILMEALFKNGNLYGITNRDFRYMAYFKNIAFINLFNLELTNLNTLPPIEIILVLSYLKDNDNMGINHQNLANNLSIEENDIKKILEKFEEFGYVKFDLNTERYKISKKGKIILEYSFRDINILNTYCYGGKFYRGEANKIKTYGSNWENYVTAVLFNAIFVIKYLEKELEQYEIHADRNATYLKDTISNLRKRIHNKFLQDDFLFFYNKLNDENKKNLLKEFEKENMNELFLQILQSPKHSQIRLMNLSDFIILAKQINDKFPKDKNEKINYRLTFVKYFYTKNIEQILETTQLHKYIFGDLADIYEEATEYDKRKQLCISIDINITILDEINNCLNEIKQEIYPKEKINDTQI